MPQRLSGLVAAALTPLNSDTSVHLDAIGPSIEHLIQEGVCGVYVCGSTGEGVSLTTSERMAVAEEIVRAVDGRIYVFIQVGHNSLLEARALAQHAAEIGADAVSATCPSYFRVDSVELLIQCMSEVASAAPDLPFFYYHIPSLTGNQLSMPRFLSEAGPRIPNLSGLKYTTPELHIFEQCMEVDPARFQIFWGTDEMLLPALSIGAEAAIGSTYNIAAPLYLRLIQAFEDGKIGAAREIQSRAIKMVDILLSYPFHSALKHVMHLRNSSLNLGPCRLPVRNLTGEQASELEEKLSAIGFMDWFQ